MTTRGSFHMFSVNNNNTQKPPMKLEALSSQELKKMRDDIDAALVVALKREKEEKINQLREKATELGLDINELLLAHQDGS